MSGCLKDEEDAEKQTSQNYQSKFAIHACCTLHYLMAGRVLNSHGGTALFCNQNTLARNFIRMRYSALKQTSAFLYIGLTTLASLYVAWLVLLFRKSLIRSCVIWRVG
jgi:hypothetical protein